MSSQINPEACTAHSGSPYNPTAAQSPSSQNPPQPTVNSDFPNYFKDLDPEILQGLFQEAISSILTRLDLPYLDKDNNLQHLDFFKALITMVHSLDPNADVCIAENSLQHLLGYIYKKIHNAMKRNPQTQVTDILFDIIGGCSSKNSKTKNLIKSYSSIFGPGTFLTLTVKFPTQSDPLTIRKILTNIQSFNNPHSSCEIYSRALRGITPCAISVSNHSERLAKEDRLEELTLNYLTFSISNKCFYIPSFDPNLLANFFKGKLTVPKKPKFCLEIRKDQIIKFAHPFLEMPFLEIDSELAGQYSNFLMWAQTRLSQSNTYELIPAFKDTRFGGAHNKFASSHNVLQTNNALLDPITNLFWLLSKMHRYAFPKYILERPLTISANLIDQYLVPWDTIQRDYSSNGKIFHGTPQTIKMFSMLRDGFCISEQDVINARAVYGKGFYCASRYEHSVPYRGKGTIMTFELNPTIRAIKIRPILSDDRKTLLKMVPTTTIPEYEEIEKMLKDLDSLSDSPLDVFMKKYHIDALLTADQNNYILIQTRTAFFCKKNPKTFIQEQLTSYRQMLSTTPEVSAEISAFEALLNLFSTKDSITPELPQ